MEHRSGGKTTVYILGAVLLVAILAVVVGIMTGIIPVRESARQPEDDAAASSPVTDTATPPPAADTPAPTPSPDFDDTAQVPEMTLPEEEQVYTVTVTFGKGGTASPAGMSTVVKGGSMTIMILPDEGYVVESVAVDGNLVNVADSLTLVDVQASHSVYVSFIHSPTEGTTTPDPDVPPGETPDAPEPEPASAHTPEQADRPKFLED